MDLRLFPAALLLIASAAIAQGETPPPKPIPDLPPGQVQPQEQAKPKARSSGDIITGLRQEKERLLREIKYAQDRAKNANKMLADKLSQRGQTFASIDAGINRPVRPAAMPMKKARILNEEERATHGDDVMLVIDGLAVRQNQFDTLMDYLKSLSNTGDDNMRAQRILFELIRVNSVAAAFPENDAEGQVSEVYAQLQSGKTMAEVGTTFGFVTGAKEDGTVDVTRNSFLGVNLERVAFTLKEGEYSRPFRNVFGFVVIGVDKIEKGATVELDKITARAVQIRYTADEETLSQAQASASRGQVEVLVRDQQVLEMLPAMYRPMPPRQNAPANPVQNMQKTLRSLEAQIKLLETKNADAPDAKAAIDSLKQQRDQIKAMIQNVEKHASDAPGGATSDQTDAPPAKLAPVKPGVKKADIEIKKAPVKKGLPKKKLTPQK